jgi:hypothetical protein
MATTTSTHGRAKYRRLSGNTLWKSGSFLKKGKTMLIMSSAGSLEQKKQAGCCGPIARSGHGIDIRDTDQASAQASHGTRAGTSLWMFPA